MPSAYDTLAFAPRPEPGRGRALGLAVLAHALLAGALTWGVHWRRDARELSAEAELWAPTARQAAPRLEEVPPPPPPPPAPAPAPAPPPEPQAQPLPVKDADIVLKRELEKKKLADEKKQREEAERRRQLEAEEKKAEAKRKLLLQRQAEEQKKRELAEKKEKSEQAAKASKAKAREQADERRAEELRQENLRRIQGLAGATGAANATGTEAKSAGPSDSYAGRIRAKVKPNIVFTDDVTGNPVAEVEVRMAPDGTITSRKIVKSSGNKGWDDAVLRALDRTEVLPRDADGRVHSPLLMEFRPKG